MRVLWILALAGACLVQTRSVRLAERSAMLYIAQSVEMKLATKDFPKGSSFQKDEPNAPGYSPSGIYGDATLAARASAEKIVNAEVDYVVREELRAENEVNMRRSICES